MARVLPTQCCEYGVAYREEYWSGDCAIWWSLLQSWWLMRNQREKILLDELEVHGGVTALADSSGEYAGAY